MYACMMAYHNDDIESSSLPIDCLHPTTVRVFALLRNWLLSGELEAGMELPDPAVGQQAHQSDDKENLCTDLPNPTGLQWTFIVPAWVCLQAIDRQVAQF